MLCASVCMYVRETQMAAHVHSGWILIASAPSLDWPHRSRLFILRHLDWPMQALCVSSVSHLALSWHRESPVHLGEQILLAPMKSLKQCQEGTPSVSKEVKAVTTCHPSPHFPQPAKRWGRAGRLISNMQVQTWGAARSEGCHGLPQSLC